jgi:hypothetical protein
MKQLFARLAHLVEVGSAFESDDERLAVSEREPLRVDLLDWHKPTLCEAEFPDPPSKNRVASGPSTSVERGRLAGDEFQIGTSRRSGAFVTQERPELKCEAPPA